MCATSIERFVYYFIGFLKCFVLTKKRFIWNKDHLLAFQININSFRNRQFQDRNHFHQPPPQWFLLGPLMLIGRLSPQTKGCRAPTCSLSTATGSDQALGKVDPPPHEFRVYDLRFMNFSISRLALYSIQLISKPVRSRKLRLLLLFNPNFNGIK